jgi:site-specific DNA-methyltransferase (adenine-specific)
MPNIDLINCDCMEYMATLPDKAFELAIVDPMYQNKDAIGIVNSNSHCANRKEYKTIANKAPDETYFGELRRVSKNQIVWGGNYFGLRGGYIFWNKNQTCFGDGELAYCSMINQVKYFEYTWNGMIQQNMKQKEFRIHPTQKPVALYQWLLKNYAKQGDRILDTHLGSGSSAIAADIMGFDFVGLEIDKDYFEAALDRFNRHKQQQVMVF